MSTHADQRNDPAEDRIGSYPRVVIVGAGFGGLRVAKDLKGAPVDITLIDRRNHHLFQPLLYQVATAGLSPADIAVPIRSVLRGQKNIRVLMDEVVGVDTQRQVVRTRAREIPYDDLIVAVGSEPSYFGHDEWARLSPNLKTVEDATAIRSQILEAFERAEAAEDEAPRRRLMTFVLVGGGPTGIEMAGAIAELAKRALARDFHAIDPRSARIILIEAGPRLLAGFPESLSRYAHRALGRMGVEVRCDLPVEKIDGDGVTAGGERIEAASVIWCAGVRARAAAAWLGAEADKAGRVKVGPDLSLPGYPDVFVIGDAAGALTKKGEPLPGLATVAKQQGAFVARLIRRRLRGDKRRMRFRYRNYGELATIGRSHAVADFGWIRFTGWLGWFVWSFVHIYFLIDFRSRLMVFVNWAWAYASFGRGARLITGG